MTKDQTLEEKRAVAGTARTKATEAREAANAKPDDEVLKEAAETAETDALRLEEEAKAPSHEHRSEYSQREKGEKRLEILLADTNKKRISEGLRPLSISEYKDVQDAAEGEEGDDKPATMGDLKKMGVIKTADSMVAELQDADLRAAVAAELPSISNTLTPEQRFQKALTLASSSKNARVAAEAARMSGRRVNAHGSGGGAPAAEESGDFQPTAQESVYMSRYKLTKEDILKSRKDAAGGVFGTGQK